LRTGSVAFSAISRASAACRFAKVMTASNMMTVDFSRYHLRRAWELARISPKPSVFIFSISAFAKAMT